MTPLTAEQAAQVAQASRAILQDALRVRVVLKGLEDEVLIEGPRLVWGQYIHEGPMAVVGMGIGPRGDQATICVPWSNVLTLHEAVAADAEGCPRCARLEAELTQAFQQRRPPRRLIQDANQ